MLWQAKAIGGRQKPIYNQNIYYDWLSHNLFASIEDVHKSRWGDSVTDGLVAECYFRP